MKSVNSLIYFEGNLQRWSLRERSWSRGHILMSLALKVKSLTLALASKPQVLENYPVLGFEDSTIFLTVEISLENARNLAKNLRIPFLFSFIGA